MRLPWFSALFFVTACTPQNAEPVSQAPAAATTTAASSATSTVTTLTEARRAFVTKVVDKQPRSPAAPTPPEGVLELVHYPSPVGQLAAYVAPRSRGGERRPAVVWIVGGFDNSIDETAWQAAPRENDQSARAFREAGVTLMLPSLRGGNDNPGNRETLYGEVDDVIAAGDWLAKQDGVDPSRIYLGGHSTGGTLALLVAETTDKFRAVFAFGPVANAGSYRSGPAVLADASEARVRSPVHFMEAIRTPTFIIEGSTSPNVKSLPGLARAAGSAPVKTFVVGRADHFAVLAPLTKLLAAKILAGDIQLSQTELDTAMGH